MKTPIVLILILLLLSVPASGDDKHADAFESIKGYFLNLPVGKDLRVIEKDLNLPEPDKTYLGSSSYHDRRFRYHSYKGLLLQIGLKQASENETYVKGKFSFNGDFWIIGNGREYVHCCAGDKYSSRYDGPVRR